jgi:ketosteroid isomerase-like protein
MLSADSPKFYALVFFLAAFAAPVQVRAQDSDEAAIRALKLGRDAYTDDVFFFSGAYGRPVIGVNEVRPADRGGARKNFKMDDKFEKIVISKSRDLAYAYGTATLSWEGREPFESAFLRVYRKENGQWKLAALFQRPIEEEGAPPVLEISEGDTALVAMHKVRPQARAQYERFMSQTWYPAARRLASKDATFGSAFSRRWRLVSLEPGSDSLLTYMFVYPAFQDAPGTTWEIYRAGGASKDQVARDSTRWSQWARSEGFAMVRDEY